MNLIYKGALLTKTTENHIAHESLVNSLKKEKKHETCIEYYAHEQHDTYLS